MEEKNSFELTGLAGNAAETLGKVLEKADNRGHLKTTMGSGTGAGIGAVLGSFGGPVAAVGAAALGAFIGNSIGKFMDDDSNKK